MSAFAIATSAVSFLVLLSFIAISIAKFGLRASYSSFASLWKQYIPIHNTNVWSTVTIVVALFLIPSLIELGYDNPLQFLGFFAPLYLVIVACTPDYLTNLTQRKVHIVFTAICAITSVLWIILICRVYFIVPVLLVCSALVALSTRTIKSSYVFWVEVALFLSVYLSIYKFIV